MFYSEEIYMIVTNSEELCWCKHQNYSIRSYFILCGIFIVDIWDIDICDFMDIFQLLHLCHWPLGDHSTLFVGRPVFAPLLFALFSCPGIWAFKTQSPIACYED